MAQPYVGEVRMFAGNFAPDGWAFCAGQLMAISENDVLFTLIGTTYGGDGQSTFRLPDLQGRIPIHFGTGPSGVTRVQGETGGQESVTISPGQLPGHAHSFGVIHGAPGNQVSPSGRVPAMSLNVVPYTVAPPTVPMNASAIVPTGGSQPHDNLQPFLCLNFIISLFGIFPSQ